MPAVSAFKKEFQLGKRYLSKLFVPVEFCGDTSLCYRIFPEIRIPNSHYLQARTNRR